MLLERDETLGHLRDRPGLDVTASGRLVFLGGQAGVGKTSSVAALAAEWPASGGVRRGSADSITTPAPFGALIEAVPELGAAIEGSDAPDRLNLLRVLSEVAAPAPTLLVLEDLHWADEATLELLRFIGRRLMTLPTLLIVATYRADEVARQHPLSLVMGDLATAAGVSRLVLDPLSQHGVAQLIDEAGSALDPEQLHGITGGNPFYVTEVLAAGGTGIPASVRDAIGARASRLSHEAQDVLAAAAVLGPQADVPLLEAVSGQSAAAVDECAQHGLLVEDGGPSTLSFRHEIARAATEESLLPGARITLHARAFAALSARGSHDDRRLAHHAAACGDDAGTIAHAVPAAVRAARLGAHREAAEQYRLALRVPGLPPEQRRRLYESLSYECYLTDQGAEALAARHQALELAQLAADLPAIGAAERWLSRLSWYSGRGADAERYGARAVETLEPLGDSHELGMAYSNLAQLRMLQGDAVGAVLWGDRAMSLARRIGDRDIEIHALNNVGAARALGEDSIDGREQLARSLELALAADAHEHVARAYTNLGSIAAQNRRFADADRFLSAGIAYCGDRDLDSWRLYMRGYLARVDAERGRYDEAERQAHDVLRHPRLAPISRIVATAVAVQVATRRGGAADPAVSEWLREAVELAAQTGEAQRLVPVSVVRAEREWTAGRPEEIARAIEPAWAAAAAHPQAWELGELSWWLHVAGVRRPAPIPLPAPFASMLAGNGREAARAWEAIGCPFWTALSLASSSDLDDARRAVDLLDELGASATRGAVLRDRHAAGLAVPRGPRKASRGNPAQLTDRELEVLSLLVEGQSNAQIAERLFLSHKTVGHHVSAVLAKLGEPTRARAAAVAVQRGIIPPR